MTVDTLFEAIGMVRDEYILESIPEEHKTVLKHKFDIKSLAQKRQSVAVGVFVWTVVLLVIIGMFVPTAPENIAPSAPNTIWICYKGKLYYRNGLPVQKLPEGYVLTGTLRDGTTTLELMNDDKDYDINPVDLIALEDPITNLKSIVGRDYYVNPDDPTTIFV